jgi:hypothetical protein
MKNKKTLLFNIIKKGLAHSNPGLFRIILDTEYQNRLWLYHQRNLHKKGGSEWSRILL